MEKRNRYPTPDGKDDTLKFCTDLDWYFHEMDQSCGLKSSMGGQIDTLELGTMVDSDRQEPDYNLHDARRGRKLFAALKLVSERHYGLLKTWYTKLNSTITELQVAEAHKAFYATRGSYAT